jgi:hypothetical protein
MRISLRRYGPSAQRTTDAATLASRAAQLDALRAALARQTAQ